MRGEGHLGGGRVGGTGVKVEVMETMKGGEGDGIRGQ